MIKSVYMSRDDISYNRFYGNWSDLIEDEEINRCFRMVEIYMNRCLVRVRMKWVGCVIVKRWLGLLSWVAVMQ